MNIEVQCTGCQSRYRVPVKMSGRMAQCKNCGQKFMVPYKSGAEAVVPDGGGPRVREAEEPVRKRRNVQHLRESGSAIAEDDGGPDRRDAFINDLMNLKAIEEEEEERKRKKFGGTQEQTFQGVPVLVTDLWVPLALVIAGYGLSIWVAVAHLLDSPGRTAGLILVGVVALLYVVLVMPLTMKMVESAAKTLDFELANAAWLQTLAAFSIPTAGMTIGFFNGGWMGLIAGGIIGLAFMMPVLMFLYRVNILTAVQAVVLASLFYVLSLAGDLAVTLGIATFVFPMWNLRLPWGEPPPVVATTQPVEAPKAAPVVERRTEVEPTTAPVVAAVPEVAPEVVEEEPKWEVPIDPQPAAVKWPGTANHILYVKPPVHLVHSTPPGAFVAVIDSDACDVYDLRTGKRSGGVKSGLPGAGAVLSGDGQFLAIVRPKTSIEIWSTQLGRPMTTIAPDGFTMPTPLFFATGGLVTTSQSGAKRSYEVWDTSSGQPVRSLAAAGAGTPGVAISAGGRVLAQLTPGQLQVFDLKEGAAVGEQKVEAPFNRVRGMSFSPDGTKLAAVVADTASRLLVWDVTAGTLAHQHPIVTDLGSGFDEVRPVWAPDSAGVLLGNSLMDVATGKVYFQLNAPVVPGSRPKATHVMTLYSVMYEFPPPMMNGERVIYRSQRVAKNDLDVALKTIRGEGWKPPGEDEATASGTEDAPTVARRDDAPASAPAAPQFNIAELVRKGEWDVNVQSVLKADPTAIAEQIRTEQAKLPALEKVVTEADRKVDQVDVYETYMDAYGNRKRRRKFSESVVSEAKVALMRAKKEVTDVKAVVARLTREMEEAEKTRTVNAALADMPGGPAVILIAEGEAVISAVDGLTPNTKCKVTGRARFADNTLTIWPRLIVPME